MFNIELTYMKYFSLLYTVVDIVPLEAQESLEGFFAGENTAPWGCTRRTKGCRVTRPQYHTSVREEDE